MKKSDVQKYAPGTPEYVVLHARWQQSRGRQPSATFLWELNPKKALALAQRMAYFPPSGVYLNGTTPKDYQCAKCGATNCKLWREYQTFSPQLLCATCAAQDQDENINTIDATGRYASNYGKTDQIGWYVPAVPTEDGSSYWGYTSVPQPGCNWWKQLPTHSAQQPASPA
jgi:hypothetical protein